jgi:HK97 family phage major capsid protein
MPAKGISARELSLRGEIAEAGDQADKAFNAYSRRTAGMVRTSGDGRMTPEESARIDAANKRVEDLLNELDRMRNAPAASERNQTRQRAEVRPAADNARKSDAMTNSLTGRTYRSVSGRPEERLAPDQSFAYWTRARYGDPDSTRGVPSSFNWNSYWTARITGRENAETRAVTGFGEDISSGSGAGLNLVGQVWSAQVIDLIRAHTFTDRLGAHVMPLHTEITNFPEWQSDVAPMYVAEGASVQGDVSPSVGILQFHTGGAVMDIAPVSKNLVMDAIGNGTVDQVVRNSIAQKYARVIDQAALYGINGSPGNPGLCAESGLLTYTAASATNYKDISKGAALVRGQNVEPNGVLWHPKTMSAYALLVDTLGQPLRMTPDIESLEFVNSGLLNYQTESSTGAFNAGALSSMFVGDWSYMTIGMRTEGVGVQVLTELLAAQNQIGFLSAMRFSIRTVRPNQTFCRILDVTL